MSAVPQPQYNYVQVAENILEALGYAGPERLLSTSDRRWAHAVVWLAGRLDGAERQIELLWHQIRLLRDNARSTQIGAAARSFVSQPSVPPEHRR